MNPTVEAHVPTLDRIFEKIEKIKSAIEGCSDGFDCIMYGNKVQPKVVQGNTELQDFDNYVAERIDFQLGLVLGKISGLQNHINQQKERIVG